MTVDAGDLLAKVTDAPAAIGSSRLLGIDSSLEPIDDLLQANGLGTVNNAVDNALNSINSQNLSGTANTPSPRSGTRSIASTC